MSVLNKDQSHYYHKAFLEKCSYELTKKNSITFFHLIIISRFRKIKVRKEKLFDAKKPIKIWDVNVDLSFQN